MKLFTYFRSSAAFRTRIALNLKGLPYESIPVNLRPQVSEQHQPQWLSKNPQGLVPLLMTCEGPLTQSLAIIEYLDEIQPQPPLLPATPVGRAQARALALTIACEIHPVNNLRVLNYLRGPLAQDEKVVSDWYRHWIAEGLRSLEEQVRRLGSNGHYMMGTQVSIADICLVPQMYNARRFDCDLTAYPTLSAISAHLEQLPAFVQAAPEMQADAAG